ncbi:26S proteasome subunit P45 family protein [Trichuris suis]|nr:26S proteasome subunit P45 family protein [Trichuris suis]
MIVEIVTLDENSICDKLAAKIAVNQKNNVGIIVKTGDERGVYFLPNPGFVPLQMLVPGELVGLHRKNRVILEMLPPCHDVRIQAMELDERPKDSYSDIGGLDAQIQELIEAIVLPITKKELFNKLGIVPSKGVLLYGPPGTGKTMLARAVAAQTKSTFLRLTGTLLIRMYIGEGAKMVRQTFELARAKAPSIIFIDEVDAIGMSRCSSERGSSREIQRTMMELLNQLDGFPVNADVRLICATNRVDILDPALLRSGRIDRKIEIPMPNEVARSRIMQLHARKMRVDPSVNFGEIASFAHDFNGAQCKAVVIEAGMIALRKNKAVISHQDFVEAVAEVQSNQKKSLHEFGELARKRGVQKLLPKMASFKLFWSVFMVFGTPVRVQDEDVFGLRDPKEDGIRGTFILRKKSCAYTLTTGSFCSTCKASLKPLTELLMT